jgi:hypothetical protein
MANSKVVLGKLLLENYFKTDFKRTAGTSSKDLPLTKSERQNCDRNKAESRSS